MVGEEWSEWIYEKRTAVYIVERRRDALIGRLSHVTVLAGTQRGEDGDKMASVTKSIYVSKLYSLQNNADCSSCVNVCYTSFIEMLLHGAE